MLKSKWKMHVTNILLYDKPEGLRILLNFLERELWRSKSFIKELIATSAKNTKNEILAYLHTIISYLISQETKEVVASNINLSERTAKT